MGKGPDQGRHPLPCWEGVRKSSVSQTGSSPKEVGGSAVPLVWGWQMDAATVVCRLQPRTRGQAWSSPTGTCSGGAGWTAEPGHIPAWPTVPPGTCRLVRRGTAGESGRQRRCREGQQPLMERKMLT